MKEFVVAVGFDGTIVDHKFPDIGFAVPGAFEWMKKFQEAGAKLILWTMRDDGGNIADVLTNAIDFCLDNGIEFYGHNKNPDQLWSRSPKCYAHIYIDDAAAGCPLVQNPLGRPYVDWEVIGPKVYEKIQEALG